MSSISNFIRSRGLFPRGCKMAARDYGTGKPSQIQLKKKKKVESLYSLYSSLYTQGSHALGILYKDLL